MGKVTFLLNTPRAPSGVERIEDAMRRDTSAPSFWGLAFLCSVSESGACREMPADYLVDLAWSWRMFGRSCQDLAVSLCAFFCLGFVNSWSKRVPKSGKIDAGKIIKNAIRIVSGKRSVPAPKWHHLYRGCLRQGSALGQGGRGCLRKYVFFSSGVARNMRIRKNC